MSIWACAPASVTPSRSRPMTPRKCPPRSAFASSNLNGSHTSTACRSTTRGKSNPAGITPMSVNAWPSSVIDRPSAFGSRPSRSVQNRSLTTATRGAPSLSSSAVNARPSGGAGPHDAEEGRRDLHAVDAHRLRPAGEHRLDAVERREVLEDGVLPPVVQEVGRRRCPAARTIRVRARPQRHEAVRPLVGQRLEQHGVDEAEDGRVRADPERQGQHGDRGETGRPRRACGVRSGGPGSACSCRGIAKRRAMRIGWDFGRDSCDRGVGRRGRVSGRGTRRSHGRKPDPPDGHGRHR